MDINEAVQIVEDHLLKYRDEHADWQPQEIRVRPSGDDHEAIKIWLGFPGDEARDLKELKQRPIPSLKAAHPEWKFHLELRAELFSLG